MRKITFALILLVLSVLLQHCEKSTEPIGDIDYENIVTIDYSDHVQPLLNDYGQILRDNNLYPQGLVLSSWNALIRGWERGEVIIPFDADNSLLVELTTKMSSSTELDSIKTAFLKRWISEGARNDAGEVPYANSRNRLYVCNQNAGSVSVIDTDAKVVIRTIDFGELGFQGGASSKPHDLAVEPNGDFWYVSLIGDGKVLKFNAAYELVGQADFVAAGLLAMHPTKDLLYVGHTLSIPNVPQTIGVIGRSTMTLQDISLPYVRPHGLVSDKSGRYIFSASLVGNAIGVVDTDADPAAANDFFFIPGAQKTIVQINVSPDNQRLVASSQQTAELLILDISNPAAITLVDSISTGTQPWHPKYSNDGSTIYVGNNTANTVSVLDVATLTSVATLGDGSGSDGLSQPHGLVVSPTDNFVYVTNRNNPPSPYTPGFVFDGDANRAHGTVVVINTLTNSIEKVIEIGPFPSGAAIYEE